MPSIVILGAGVMGTALAMTAASHSGNNTYLVGSPLDDNIIRSIKENRWHPVLQVDVPSEVSALYENDLCTELLQCADVIVIGVSSPGVAWAVDVIQSNKAEPECIALVTKGLVAARDIASAPETYATALDSQLDKNKLLGIGGPCIARELALRIPTSVAFAATNPKLADKIKTYFQTAYYRVSVHHDFVGLEACAALKNFYCIGISAMLGAWDVNNISAKNPVAALFNQAVIEMNMLCHWIRQSHELQHHSTASEVAFDLPGMGDLHVTVGGGRNSKLGMLLGKGQRLSEIMAGSMKDVTVEGVDTGKQLLSGFNHAVNNGSVVESQLPLTRSILNSIEKDQLFAFDFASIPTQ